MIRVRYFARFREQLGLAGEEIPYQPAIRTATDLLAHLRARGGVWAATLAESERVMTAVNQEIVRHDTAIHDSDEVAIFPPVTGG